MTESDPRSRWPLVGAGALMWAVAGAPQIVSWVSSQALFDGRAFFWCAAYAAFAVGFALAAGIQRLPARTRIAALVAQSVAALVVWALGHSGFEGALLCVVAGEAPLVVGAGPALVWVVAQTMALFAVRLEASGKVAGVYLSTAAYGGFQLFAFGASRLAAREAAARQELSRMHAELLATQELFADSTRTAERLRIARELHDALGHHMTALSLQLEVARNVAEGRAKEPVDRAHALTKELLGELRTVVGAMREDQPIDLPFALRTLVGGIPRPRVHLEVPADLRVEPAVAHAIFRCVQEALTNAVKHAEADNVYLAIEEREGTISILAEDDGHGAAALKSGHGLTGLRERIEGMGGHVEVEGRPGTGFSLRALVPLRGGSP
jgi:signal transduction histidine kinase